MLAGAMPRKGRLELVCVAASLQEARPAARVRPQRPRKCYFCFCRGRVAPWTAVTSKASLTVQRHAVLRVGVSHLLVYRVPFEFASGEVWGHHFFVEDKAPLVIAWLSTGSLSQGPPPLPSLAPASTALNRWAETPRALLVALPLLSLPWPPSPF